MSEASAMALPPAKKTSETMHAWLMLSPMMLFMLTVFIVPLAYMLWVSVSEPVLTLKNYTQLFSTELYARILNRTFLISFMVTVGCLLLAYPIAFYAARHDNWLSRVLLLSANLGFWLSFIVRTYAWMVILGTNGPVVAAIKALGVDPAPRILFTSMATGIGLVHILLPYMILSLYAIMARIDSNLDRAALSLGATPWRSFRQVFLPLSLPGVANGCMLTFIFCIGFYVTPALLGGPKDLMIAGLIAMEITEVLDWGVASAMAAVLLAITLFIIMIYDRLFGLDRLWG